MTHLDQPREAWADIRRRLFNPPNGRTSSELDIVGEEAQRLNLRRKAMELEALHKAELDFRRRAAIDNAIKTALLERAEAQRIADRLIAEDKLPPRPPTILQILYAVEREFGIGVLDLISERRSAPIALARQVAMYIARRMTMKSLPQIARPIGNRDHTTVLHAIRKIDGLILHDFELAERVARIRSKLSTDLVASCVSAQTETQEE